MSEWQPIETAPRGTAYLGIIEYAPGKFGEPFICEWDDEHGQICKHQTELLPHKPTHWMPLPPPPQENSK